MEIRESIIREASGLFILMGVKKVKMDIVAKRLKISKRTIYENFKDKDSLIRATIDLFQQEQNEINKKILDDSENIIEAVLNLLKYGSEILGKINPKYYSDLQRLYPKIWKEKIEQNKVELCKFTLELLKKGKEQGLYRDDLNVEIIAHILIEQLTMLSDQRFIAGRKFSPVEIYENIVISMTRGIATVKGLELLEKYHPDATHL